MSVCLIAGLTLFLRCLTLSVGQCKWFLVISCVYSDECIPCDYVLYVGSLSTLLYREHSISVTLGNNKLCFLALCVFYCLWMYLCVCVCGSVWQRVCVP